MKKIILMIQYLFFSAYLLANDINCKSPISTQEMRICENIVLKKLEDKMNKSVKDIANNLLEYQGKKNRDEFLNIQKDWKKLISRQCLNERTIFGKGTMGGISQITCIQYFYKQRIKYFKISYQSSM
jgi:uncharacterized protein